MSIAYKDDSSGEYAKSKNLILSSVVKSFCECRGSGGVRMDGTCGRCTKPLETEQSKAICFTTYRR